MQYSSLHGKTQIQLYDELLAPLRLVKRGSISFILLLLLFYKQLD